MCPEDCFFLVLFSLSSDGMNSKNIDIRISKGIDIISQIIHILETVIVGEHYTERDSMFLNEPSVDMLLVYCLYIHSFSCHLVYGNKPIQTLMVFFKRQILVQSILVNGSCQSLTSRLCSFYK